MELHVALKNAICRWKMDFKWGPCTLGSLIWTTVDVFFFRWKCGSPLIKILPKPPLRPIIMLYRIIRVFSVRNVHALVYTGHRKMRSKTKHVGKTLPNVEAAGLWKLIILDFRFWLPCHRYLVFNILYTISCIYCLEVDFLFIITPSTHSLTLVYFGSRGQF